jgi:hypothetical protein
MFCLPLNRGRELKLLWNKNYEQTLTTLQNIQKRFIVLNRPKAIDMLICFQYFHIGPHVFVINALFCVRATILYYRDSL